MNTKRIVLGGLAAGLLIDIVEGGLSNVVVGGSSSTRRAGATASSGCPLPRTEPSSSGATWLPLASRGPTSTSRAIPSAARSSSTTFGTPV
jgi:hypothetical protein